MNRLMLLPLIAVATLVSLPTRIATAQEDIRFQNLDAVEREGLRIIQGAIARDMAPEYVVDEVQDRPRQVIAKLIDSAENARPLTRKEIRAIEIAQRDGTELDIDSHSLRWMFKSEIERERRLLELKIRQELLPPTPKVLKYPDIPYLIASPLDENGSFRRVATGHGLTFAERVSKDVVHVNANVRVDFRRDEKTGRVIYQENRRFAVIGLSEEQIERLENGRPVLFNAVIYGTDTYTSVTGERTIGKMTCIDDTFLAKVMPKAPREQIMPGPSPIYRNWTSLDGKFKTEARVDTVDSDTVTIIKRDGTKVSVPFSKLSKEDTEWARAYRAALGPWNGPTL